MRYRTSSLMRWGAVAAVAGVALASACDPFKVSDPSRYTDEALDSALQSVADGAEGQFQLTVDDYVIYTALLSDEWQHTGTWAGYDDVDKGRARYGSSPADFIFNALMRARYATQDAQQRFKRVGLADTDPKVVQVKSVEGWIDLYLGAAFCEATQGQGTEAISDIQMLQQAGTKLKAALALAQQAGLTQWINADRAGIARAALYAGNYAEALTYAQQVPNGFTYWAKFSTTSDPQRNWVVLTNTVGFNKAAGMRQKWWSQVDTIASKLRDPWTGQLDPRVEIRHPGGSLGVDGKTPHYSQWKYKTLADDIAITKSEEMRLIEAEVAWRNNDLVTAMARLNALRAAVGLNPLPDPGSDAARVRDYLLSERFAVLFMEGQRLADLNRFNLIASYLGAGRLKKFPLSQFEAQNSPNGVIADDATKRCAPVS